MGEQTNGRDSYSMTITMEIKSAALLLLVPFVP